MKITIRQDVEKLEKKYWIKKVIPVKASRVVLCRPIFLGAISLPALGLLEIDSEEYKKSLIAELKRNCY